MQQEVVDVAGYGRDAAADRIDLGPYTNAVVPGPLPGQFPEDAEGWSQIDGWGAYECAVSFTVCHWKMCQVLSGMPEVKNYIN